MKVRNYLESIAGVGVFPVITLLLFFSIFCIFSIWAFRSRKAQFESELQMPFDDGAMVHSSNDNP